MKRKGKKNRHGCNIPPCHGVFGVRKRKLSEISEATPLILAKLETAAKMTALVTAVLIISFLVTVRRFIKKGFGVLRSV